MKPRKTIPATDVDSDMNVARHKVSPLGACKPLPCRLIAPQDIHGVRVALADLIVEPGVFDAERCKVGHGYQEVHLRIGEGAALLAVDTEHADGPVVGDQGDAGDGVDAFAGGLLGVLKTCISGDIGQLRGSARENLSVDGAVRYLDRSLVEIRVAQAEHGLHLQSLAFLNVRV